jgi:hypothetical protein
MTTVNGTLATAPSTTTGIPRAQRSRRRLLLTFADAVDHVLRVDEVSPGATRAVERAELAVRAANKSFITYCTQGFRYYDSRAHIVFGANVPLGSVTVSGNVITPTTAPSWPSWMELAQIRVDGKTYPVLSYTSGSATVSGLPNGTYTSAALQQGFARLPSDFRRRGSISDGDQTYPVVDAPSGILHSWEDYYEWANSAANPVTFAAIAGDRRFHGELMLAVWPTYVSETVLSVYYERYPADLDYQRVGSGTVSTTGLAVTASTSVFKSEHVGCAIVISTDATSEIQNPLSSRSLVDHQRIITSVSSGTAATIDKGITGDVDTRAYYITDVVDVQPGAQEEAFLRLCEYEFARASKSKYSDKKFVEFRQQMEIAMADDARYKDSVDGVSYLGDGYIVGDVSGRPDL